MIQYIYKNQYHLMDFSHSFQQMMSIVNKYYYNIIMKLINNHQLNLLQKFLIYILIYYYHLFYNIKYQIYVKILKIY